MQVARGALRGRQVGKLLVRALYISQGVSQGHVPLDERACQTAPGILQEPWIAQGIPRY
jgi:hypothetical protein